MHRRMAPLLAGKRDIRDRTARHRRIACAGGAQQDRLVRTGAGREDVGPHTCHGVDGVIPPPRIAEQVDAEIVGADQIPAV